MIIDTHLHPTNLVDEAWRHTGTPFNGERMLKMMDGPYMINGKPRRIDMGFIQPPPGNTGYRDGNRMGREGIRDYMAYCAPCHGLDRRGNVAAGFPSLLDVLTRKTREQITLVTEKGSGRMPAFDQFSAAQRQAILDYVLGVQPADTARPNAAAGPAGLLPDPRPAGARSREFHRRGETGLARRH